MQLSETCRERLQRSAEKVIEVDMADRIIIDCLKKMLEHTRKFRKNLQLGLENRLIMNWRMSETFG